MKYFLYIVLLYILLPFNIYIDLVAILVFYLVFNENEKFTLLFAGFAGLLIDLFYPVVLGMNILIYLILVQILLYIKKYMVHGIWVNWAVFAVYSLVKNVITHLVLATPLKVQTIFFTIVCFLPLYLFLNRIRYKTWIKT